MHRAEQLVWNRIGSVRSDLPPDVELHGRADDAVRLPHHVGGADRRREPRPAARLRLLPSGAARSRTSRTCYRAEVAGGDLREIEVIVRPADLLAARPVGRRPRRPDRPDQRAPAGRPRRGRAAGLPDARRHPARITSDRSKISSCPRARTSRCASRTWPTSRCCTPDRVQSVGYARKDAVVVTVFRRLGGNTVNISNDVHALLDADGLTLPAGDTRKKPPRDVTATVAYDQSRFVEDSVGNVRDAILVGGLFSILILLVFLRSWRATLLSALAIPTTLAITLPLPVLDRRDAQPDVAGRPGRGHRPHHRRHRRGHREHRAPPDAGRRRPPPRPSPAGGGSKTNALPSGGAGRSPPPPGGEGRGGGNGSRRRGLEGDHRGGHRLDADDGAGVRAAGVHHRRLRPVLRLAELVAVHRRAGVDGHQPDGGAGVRGQVPGRPADAGAGSNLPLFRPLIRSASGIRAPLSADDADRFGGGGGPRRPAVHGDPEPVRGPAGRAAAAGAAGQGTGDRPDAGDGRGSFCPRLLGADRHAAGRDGPRRRRSWKRSSCTTPTWRPTSGAPGRRTACSPRRPTAATSRWSCARPRTT